jgi:hypothetical protein
MGSVVRSINGFLPKPLTTTSHKGRFGHSGSLTDPLEEMPKTASSMKRYSAKQNQATHAELNHTPDIEKRPSC